MHEVLSNHFESALVEFSQGAYYDKVLKAKSEYFTITGQLNDEDEDYENRMNLFNDWYVLQYVAQDSAETIMEEYVSKKQLVESIATSFYKVNYSLFEYTGENFRKNLVLKDTLHKQKILLPRDHPELPLLKGDLFVGRVLEYEESFHLMSGICILPKVVKSVIKKQFKKLKKLDEPGWELKFLLKVESLKTRWNRYGHLDAKKIFVFDKK